MEIITSIIPTIGEMLVEPTRRQLGYLFCYEANIKALDDENDKLKERRDDVQKLIDAAMRNSEVMGDELKGWVGKVDDITKELEKFLKEDAKADKMCLNGWCPNLKLQHSLGRKAKKYTEVVLKLQEDGKPFAKVFHPAGPTEMHFSSSMKDFNSRKKILNQVMEALRNEKVSVTAICGMGGIGKTTMAKEVAKRAKDEKLFGEVVMVTVSQSPNVRQIQGTIADFLGLKLGKESKDGRADELRQRILKNIKNILVILDDLWNELDLEAVGIPDGCEILLTSRDRNVCKSMKSNITFPMEGLPDDEAWNLFKEVAEISDRTCDLYDVAKEVAKECSGLPVAIVTVGKALEGRDEREWRDALRQLQNSKLDSILEMDERVYSRIELSYNFLRSKEAKSCFLLCCLFPEDYDIGIETLVRFWKGLRLFEVTDTTEDARNRVYTLVQELKRCFLLMDGDKKECVKMHDIIRDVAISIASIKGHGGFVVKCDNQMEVWPEIDLSEMEECTAISLVYKKIKKHPDSLVCPKLKLLSLSSTFNKYVGSKLELSENFFGGIKEIKVLAFQGVNFQSLPASLQILQNLRTLHLEYCDLGDISRIRGLVMLEILSLIGSRIKELPVEIRNLQHLKVLDMTECDGLDRIPPGVLSSLTTLEELKIDCFRSWNSLEGNEEKTSASLDEITPLLDRYLKVLNVWIPQVEFVPRNFPVKNLTRFSINVGRYDINKVHLFENRLKLDKVSADAKKQSEIYPLVKECEDLFLKMVYNLKNLFENNLWLEQVSADAIKQRGIYPLVKKCEGLVLEKVYNLKNLFPHFDEEEQDGFPWLRTLQVRRCKDMEYVVKFTSNNNRTDLQVPNIFPLLEELELAGLDGLKGIFHYNSDDLQLPPIDHARLIMHSQQHQFLNLKHLQLHDCGSMNYIFSASSIPRGFPQLQRLDVRGCSSLEEIVSVRNGKTDDPNNTSISDDMILFPKLTYLYLQCLERLISLCRAIDDEADTRPRKDADGVESSTDNMNTPTEILVPFKCIKWLPSLENLEVLGCDSIKVLFSFLGDDSPQLDNHKEEWLKNLEELKVSWCLSLEVVFDYGEGPLAPALNKLKHLELYKLQKLMHIWKKGPQQVKAIGFQNLKTLSIKECPSLRYLFTASIAKLLVMLESLKVAYCRSMEEVVAKTEEEINNVQAESYVVSFPHLLSIELDNLDNLYCFCQQPYAFEFPSLETLQITKCSKLQTFVTANKTPKIPKLKGVELNGNHMEILEQDLNGTIRHCFEANQIEEEEEEEEVVEEEEEEPDRRRRKRRRTS